MKSTKWLLAALVAAIPLNSFAADNPAAKNAKAGGAKAAGKKAKAAKGAQVLFDFEQDVDGWRIPTWATSKQDNASVEVGLADQASSGKKSLKLSSKFVPNAWSGAYVEVEREEGQYIDLSPYTTILADIFIPADAPAKLKGKFILTVGPDWSWTEARTAMELKPGEWNTISADVTPDSKDWRVQMTPDLSQDVRKMGVRVEANKVDYQGDIIIDNIRAAGAKK